MLQHCNTSFLFGTPESVAHWSLQILQPNASVTIRPPSHLRNTIFFISNHFKRLVANSSHLTCYGDAHRLETKGLLPKIAFRMITKASIIEWLHGMPSLFRTLPNSSYVGAGGLSLCKESVDLSGREGESLEISSVSWNIIDLHAVIVIRKIQDGIIFQNMSFGVILEKATLIVVLSKTMNSMKNVRTMKSDTVIHKLSGKYSISRQIILDLTQCEKLNHTIAFCFAMCDIPKLLLYRKAY